VISFRRWWLPLALLAGCWPLAAPGQIDPIKRDLIQVGYNAAFEGHAPIAAYGFYYRNQPDFLETNLTLRMAIAPVYMDSELGISGALGPNTDLGIGIAGGGFADNYYEIERGAYIPGQSFTGYGAESSLSVYHLFNPGALIPLNGLLRGTAHFATYERNDDTAPNFKEPGNLGFFDVRAGLRFGGREPLLFPDLAMELSLWYYGQFRSQAETYGIDNDRRVEPQSHSFLGEAALSYTLPELKHSFGVALTAATSIDADRFSAYRLGGFLPLAAEFPLSLPGYYYQELSARRFVLFGGDYILPLDSHQRWNLTATAATAVVDYLPGLSQPGAWNSGVAGGLMYRTQSWKFMATYAYGVDAIRSHGRGANSIEFLMQLDLEKANFFKATDPSLWRGFQQMFNLFGK